MDSTTKIGTAVLGGAILVLGVNVAVQPNGGVTAPAHADAAAGVTNSIPTVVTNSTTTSPDARGHEDKGKKSAGGTTTPSPK